jgi:hypothetical protein
VVSLSSPHTTYSSRRARDSHVEGSSPFGSVRLTWTYPLASGLLMASSVALVVVSVNSLAPFTCLSFLTSTGESADKISSPFRFLRCQLLEPGAPVRSNAVGDEAGGLLPSAEFDLCELAFLAAAHVGPPSSLSNVSRLVSLTISAKEGPGRSGPRPCAIHRSAWNTNSRKFISSILHTSTRTGA